MAATDVEAPEVTTVVDDRSSTTVTQPVDAPFETADPNERRRWPWLAAAATLVIALAGVLIWLLWPDTPPQPPESLRVETAGSASIELRWDTPPGPTVESYVVLHGQNEVGSVAAPATTTAVTDLTPNTRYQFTIVSVDGDRRSEPSDPITATTDPGTPTALDIRGATATSVELQWDAPPGPTVESYVVVNGEEEVGSVATPATSIDVTGLTPNTRYELTVIAVDGDRRSESSYTIGITTDPGTPASLQFEDLTATSVVLRWQAPPGPSADGYVISDLVDDLSTVGHPETSFMIADLIPGATYDFFVAAQAGVRRSVPAVVTVTASTPIPGELASDPAQNTTDTVVVTWSPPADVGAATEYVVTRDDATVATVPGDTFAYTDTGLAPATAYEYRVAASWGYEPSEPTAAIAVSTAAPPIADARLVGSSPVEFTTTEDPGANLDVGTTWTSSWRFEPSCDAGACDVTLFGDHTPPGFTFKDFTIDLVRDGASYTGSGAAEMTYCNAEPVANTVTARLTVDGAEVSDGRWVATSWSGTLEISSPYIEVGEFYCPEQRVTADINATR